MVDPPIPPPAGRRGSAPRRAAHAVWRLTVDVVREFRKDRVGDLAASITFWTLLSIPAVVLALVSAASSLSSIVGADLAADMEEETVAFVGRTFADSVTLQNAVRELFDGANTGVLTVATLAAFYSISRGFSGLIRALDAAYDVGEGRPWWQVRIVGLGLGLSTVVIVAASTVLLALLPRLPGSTILRVSAVPITVLGLVSWAMVVFHVGPNRRTPWRYELPGAVVTAVGWVLASQGFALYVRATADANEVQSTVGTVLLGLTLAHLLSVVMLVGAEVNDVLSRRAGIDTTPVSMGTRLNQVRDRLEDRFETKTGDAEAELETEAEDIATAGPPARHARRPRRDLRPR